jgi:uncharacterized membrane protein YebE (DUF533 family)
MTAAGTMAAVMIGTMAAVMIGTMAAVMIGELVAFNGLAAFFQKKKKKKKNWITLPGFSEGTFTDCGSPK